MPQKYPEKYPEELNLTQIKILESINENKRITRKELAEKINLSDAGIKKNLNKLKKKRLLKRIGPDKGGYWKIIKTN